MTADQVKPRALSLRVLAMHCGAAFMLLFLLATPAIRSLTFESNRSYGHFHWSHYVEMLALAAVVAVPAGGLLLGLRRVSVRFKPVRRAALSALAVLPFMYLMLFTLQFFGAFYFASGLQSRWGNLLWIALLAPFALSERLYGAGEKAVTVLIKLLSPLPVVMLIYFASLPDLSSIRQPAPDALQEARTGAPVYILVFDALDSERAFAPENNGRYPALAKFRSVSTWFSDSRTPATGTVNVLPCLLYQQRAEVTRVPDGAYLLDGQSAHEQTSMLTSLSGPDSTRVVGGFHLNFRYLLQGQYHWLREHNLSRENTRPDLIARGIVTSSLDTMFAPNCAPFDGLRLLADSESHAADIVEIMLEDLTWQLLACASSLNHDVIAFFHLPVPHTPHVFGRDGRVARVEDLPPEQGYLRNVEQVDAIFERFRAAMESSGQWDKATVIVTGDHGLTYDDHPPLIVKLPGQKESRVVEGEFYTSSMLSWLREQPEFKR